MTVKVKSILFVCVANAGRSQMAEGFFNHLAKGRFISTSAGTKPGSAVDPIVIKVMQEAGIDIHDRQPKCLTLKAIESSDRVITMGCGAEENCPNLPLTTKDWQITDPKGKTIEEIRQIRDEIRGRVTLLIKELL